MSANDILLKNLKHQLKNVRDFNEYFKVLSLIDKAEENYMWEHKKEIENNALREISR